MCQARSKWYLSSFVELSQGCCCSCVRTAELRVRFGNKNNNIVLCSLQRYHLKTSLHLIKFFFYVSTNIFMVPSFSCLVPVKFRGIVSGLPRLLLFFLKFAAIFFTDGAKPDFNTAVTGLTRLSSFHQKPPRTPKNIIYPFLSRPSVRWWRFGGEKSCLKHSC